MKKVCILDGERILDRDMLHGLLQEALALPGWYGRNLDALYDCLTDRVQEADIYIRHTEALERNLGKYAASLLCVLKDAAAENPGCRLFTSR